MFIWTETTAKRGSEIASILLKYLRLKNTTGQEKYAVFIGKCGDQNKNLLTMSLWFQLVRQKYLKLFITDFWYRDTYLEIEIFLL